ncbi:hypothetical protein [Brachybacterium tyrofermentans]|uniref:hypothetical protein n=1 Tax=Brachybacterium tyrofermentans TaxID=47848 RepID=UPI003FCF6E4D
MMSVFEMLWPVGSSLGVSVVVTLITSHLAVRRWRRERVASARDEAYKDLTNAAYRWARILRDNNVKELDHGEESDVDALEESHNELNDSLFMLSKVAEEGSFRRIDEAYGLMVAAALNVDVTDPALRTTGTEAGLRAQQAISEFVNVVSSEMRTHLER